MALLIINLIRNLSKSSAAAAALWFLFIPGIPCTAQTNWYTEGNPGLFIRYVKETALEYNHPVKVTFGQQEKKQ